jgi:homogentisate 1,2-dioxygenase
VMKYCIVDGDFMSRNNIEQGHIMHPKVPHGPAPGAMERSIGHTGTELAVMVDTFDRYQGSHGIRRWSVL